MGKHQKIVATNLQNVYYQSWLYVKIAQYVSKLLVVSCEKKVEFLIFWVVKWLLLKCCEMGKEKGPLVISLCLI